MAVANLHEFIKAAFDRGCEASIMEVAALFEIPLNEHPFELCIAVEAAVKKYGIELVPPLPKGSEQSLRLFCTPPMQLSSDQMRAKIALGEGATSEFKSSMIFCMRTLLANPGASKNELRSDAVIHGVLKTIAAFLNTAGGSLYVGVDDNGQAVGLDPDFRLIGKMNDIDSWELKLRELIDTKFIDGKTINNSIQLGFAELDGVTIAHVSVAPRVKISYLKRDGAQKYEVYVRQGNKTVSLTMPEFEEYLACR